MLLARSLTYPIPLTDPQTPHKIGSAFDVEVVTLRNSSRYLYVSTQGPKGSGSVIIYTVPNDLLQGPWVKRTVATGFKPKFAFLPGRGSPGNIVVGFKQRSGIMVLTFLIFSNHRHNAGITQSERKYTPFHGSERR